MIFGFFLTLAAALPTHGGKGPVLQKSEPIYSCNKGVNLVGKKCMREFSEPAMRYCPMGFQQRGDGKSMTCAQTAQKIGNCPIGTLSAGKGCSHTEKTSYLESCPVGYQSFGKECARTVPLPMVTKCLQGTMTGKQCVSLETVSYISEVYCPAGYMQTGKGCERSSTYDCTPQQQSKKGGFSGHGHLRFLGHQKRKHQQTSKKAVPAPKVQVIQKTCSKTEFSKPISKKYCPAGFMEAGKECSRKIVTQPIQVCSSGHGSGKDCSTKEVAPMMRVCPGGYKMSGKQCLRQVEVPRQYNCPIGFNESGKGCEKFANSSLKCHKHGLQLRGEMCFGQTSEEPTLTYQVTCVGKNCANH